MFGDLRDAMGDAVVPIAIVRVDPVEYDDETVRYGLSMLQKTASEVIDWTNAAQRAEFVEARRRTALAAA